MNDYEKIAQVIEYILEHYRTQPDLETLAARVNLSASHFHRLFHRWAGVTPKAFVQHLTALESGRRLREGRDVLSTSLDLGLSGPGRLHDLCVNLEAASPGEIKSGGAGWRLVGGFVETPFGSALVGITPRGICKLAFVTDDASMDFEWRALCMMWPKAEIIRDDLQAKDAVASAFSSAGSRSAYPISVLVKGTTFQLKVWRALIQISPSETISYKGVAEWIDSPKSSRAVGNAVGRNPIAYLIPCHRVIHGSGQVGHYHWGSTRKKAMLALEAAS